MMKFLLPLSALALLAGCASNSDVAQLRQDVDGLRSQVQQAQQTASAAETEARSASERASSAQQQAQAASSGAYNRSLRK